MTSFQKGVIVLIVCVCVCVDPGMRQQNDHGSQYRSAVYTSSPAQHQAALKSKASYQQVGRPGAAYAGAELRFSKQQQQLQLQRSKKDRCYLFLLELLLSNFVSFIGVMGGQTRPPSLWPRMAR